MKLLVLGGGLVGCETGLFLAERGHQVTIIEMQSEIAPEANWMHKEGMMQAFGKAPITARTGLESDSAGRELGLAYIAVDSDAYQHVTKVDLAGNRSAQSEFVRYVSSSSALWNGLKAAWKSEGTR